MPQSDTRAHWKVHLFAGSDDTNRFVISRKAACQSLLIQDMLANDDDPDTIPEIPLFQVNKDILEKVVEFLNFHEDNPMPQITKPIKTSVLLDSVGEWDASFMDCEMDQEKGQEFLVNIALAANYLHIPSLLDLAICKLACTIKDLNETEAIELFKLKDDNRTAERDKIIEDQCQCIFDL